MLVSTSAIDCLFLFVFL